MASFGSSNFGGILLNLISEYSYSLLWGGFLPFKCPSPETFRPAPPCLNPGVLAVAAVSLIFILSNPAKSGRTDSPAERKRVRSQGDGRVDARRGHCKLEFGILDSSLNIDPTLLHSHIFTKMGLHNRYYTLLNFLSFLPTNLTPFSLPNQLLR